MSQDIAHPSNPASLSNADIFETVRQFVFMYAVPTMPDVAYIFQGWENRSSLPPGMNEFAVISMVLARKNGTTVESFAVGEDDIGRINLAGFHELFAQVDLCSDSAFLASTRAMNLKDVTRSSIGVQFFNDNGMSALFADDARDLSNVGGENQYVKRYSVTLHLGFNSGVAVDFDSFDRVEISRLENVDVHHKP